MSLTSTIEEAVEQAFQAAGDLVKTGVLSEETVTGFNFSQGEVVSNEQPYNVDFIEISSILADDLHIVKQLVIRTKDLEGSRYSTITFDSNVYRFEKLEQYTGVTLLTVRSV